MQSYAGNPALNSLEQMEKRLRAKDPNAIVSALFVRQGKPILAMNPDQLVKLASVTKIITAVTALEDLGATRRFSTKVFFQKKHKRLYIQGEWDPLLDDGAMRELAECVYKKAGKGPIRVFVVKKTRKQLPYCGPKDKNDHVYAAQPASLMVNLSAVKITLGPVHKRQLPVNIRPDAGDYFKVNKRVRLVRRGRRPGVAVKTFRGNNKTIIRVRGRFPVRARSVSVLKRVFHPLLFAGWVFQQALKNAGIKVLQQPVTVKKKKGNLICTHKSKTMAKMLVPILQKSLNQGAQAIENAIVPGNQIQTLQAVKTVLHKAGVPDDAGFISNGSGLGCGGISTTRSIVKVLLWSMTRPWTRAFWNALPKPGKGTLKHRFLDGPANLRAKTGTLDDCTALAGAFDDPSGKRIFFAVVVNARDMNRIKVIHRINKLVESFGK